MAETKPSEQSSAKTATEKKAQKNKAGGEKSKTKLIIVRSTKPPNPDGSDPVVLHEQDPRHPNGFAFIAGKNPVEVFPTPAVNALLREALKDITNGDDEEEELSETEE